MATNPTIRRIPRDKLFQVFKTQELVKLVEEVLYGVGDTLPANNRDVRDIADQAALDAEAALLAAEGRLEAADMVGAVQWFAKDVPPTVRWLACDGATHAIADYPDLAAYLGTQWGGDGVTTFGVPDLRGEFVRGWDDGRGVDPARAFGSSQADELESHSHTASGSFVSDTGATNAATAAGAGWAAGGTVIIGSTGGAETRPRNVALLPCIHV